MAPHSNERQDTAPPSTEQLLQSLAPALRERGWVLVTAESCTGGLIAATCTSVPGSSAWLDAGFITYSNSAKTRLLGVPSSLIRRHGAVSSEVALAMAQGAAATCTQPTVVVAVTGIAGPDGGSAHKPVGTVWMALSAPGSSARSELLSLSGDRAAVRAQTVHAALAAVLALALAPN
jgi:nicotinamide-nucleotide amidase